MATSRYEYFETVWNDLIQHTQKGIMNQKLKDIINSVDYIYYSIPLGQKYRPDLIAYNFYGDGKLYWILTYANDIYDSPEGFYTTRRIKIPNPSVLNLL